MRRSVILRAGCASLGLLAALTATPAMAQSSQPGQPVETEADGTPTDSAGDIVVTGSRIRRDPLERDSPVTFVDENATSRGPA